MKYFLIVCSILGLSACTDTTVARFSALGSAGEIICYSGGKEIFKGRSTGKILNEEQSDGWSFKDSSTGKLVRVTGDCVIYN